MGRMHEAERVVNPREAGKGGRPGSKRGPAHPLGFAATGAAELRSLLASAFGVRATAVASVTEAVHALSERPHHPVHVRPSAEDGLLLVRQIGQRYAEARRQGKGPVPPIVAELPPCPGDPAALHQAAVSLMAAGASGLWFSDRMDDGHGEVLLPVEEVRRALTALRLAAGRLGVPAVVFFRTHALTLPLVASRRDEARSLPLPGLAGAVQRAVTAAPYVDVLAFDAPFPDLDEARVFAVAVQSAFPGKTLAYGPSSLLPEERRIRFESGLQRALLVIGYRWFTAGPLPRSEPSRPALFSSSGG
jgi:hypothetical protein